QGGILRQHQARNGDTLAGLPPGNYTVQVTTTSGCDTTLHTEVWPLPMPEAMYDADTIVCKGVPLSFTNGCDAPVWEWHFGDGSMSRERNPGHVYVQPGIYGA